MTPNNILNMAMLKQLDFVAITDHNSAKQLPTIREIEQSYDFIIIPGIEVTVQEGFDVLCYFKTYELAYELDSYLEQHLKPSDFGPFSKEDQIITDLYDVPKGIVSLSLRSKTVPYHDLVAFVKERDGIVILAHIDRNSKSAILYYPLDELEFDGLEIQPYDRKTFIESHPDVSNFPLFFSSDSHTLLTLHERTESIELPEKTIDAFFTYVKRGRSHE